MSIKTSIYNITHANKLAKEKQAAEKKMKILAISSSVSVTGIGLSSLIGGYLWRKKFIRELEEKERLHKEKLAKLEAAIGGLNEEETIDLTPEEINSDEEASSNNFQEV
jgi:hypothetical protein